MTDKPDDYILVDESEKYRRFMEKYGIETLRIIPDWSLEQVLNYREEGEPAPLSNTTVAVALLSESANCRKKLMRCLPSVRRDKIVAMMNEYESGALSVSSEDMSAAKEKLLLNLIRCEESGRVIFVVSDDFDYEALFAKDEEETINEGRLPEADWEKEPGDFDLHQSTYKQVIDYWVARGTSVRRIGRFYLDKVLDRIKTPYCRRILEMALDDCTDSQIMDESGVLQKQVLEDMGLKLDLIHTGILSIYDHWQEPWKTLETYLARFPAELAGSLLDMQAVSSINTPLITDDMPPVQLVENMVAYADLAGREGLVFLEKYFEDHPGQSPYFISSALFLMCTSDQSLVDAYMRNKKEAVLHYHATKMNMFETVCLCLRKGINPLLMKELLNSFMDEEISEKDLRE